MKYRLRIKRECKTLVEGRLRSFDAGEEVEMDEDEGRALIRHGLAVPGGIQYGKPVTLPRRR